MVTGPFAGLGTHPDGRDMRTWGRKGHLSDAQENALVALDARAPLTFPADDPLLARYEAPTGASCYPIAPAPARQQQQHQPHRDLFLLRLLRARDFDVDAAETLLHAVLAWRRANRPWSIARTDAERPEASFHIYNTGARDDTGRPVLYALQRSMKRAVMDVEAFRKATIFFIESVVMSMENTQDQFALIYDFEGFSVLKHTSLAAAQAMFQIVQEAYPDSLGAAYALPNYPLSFYTVFKLTRGFIGPLTASKIVFLSTATFKQDLAHCIGKDALPPWLGGTLAAFQLPPMLL
jgi:CRAL/TRIO domain/CRAL/TRIO, N-terminal domain